ncbi:MAG TPA: acyl carrier protein [Gemmatimonadales bacterium]|jgi:acyl carrier protein|nr:acyl carrier protein [Gemmatimonadales bacterium]
MPADSLTLQVAEIVGLTLRRSPGELVRLQREEISEWDSLKHMEIVFAVEDSFGIEFREDELPYLNSVALIREAVERHRAT